MKRRVRLVIAPLLAGAMIAAACGGSDDDAGDTGAEEEAADSGGDEEAPEEEPADTAEADEPTETAESDEPADTSAESADTAADAEGGGAEAEGEGEGDASGSADMGTDIDPASVTRGGTLTYLLEAETDTWDITGGNCAVACITVMRAVADPMLIVNADNELEPFLLESYEVNDDFTEWTFTMREGVVFHDGTPVDGAAIYRNLIEMASGTLQGQVFWDLANGSLFSTPPGDPADSIEQIDDMTVRVTFGVPVATFGYALAERTGWVYAPSFWDDPERVGALPVSTGPFRMVDQTRGEVTTLEANPDYWRMGADEQPLPYLDGIDFRPVPDVDARLATMEAGDADVNQDSFNTNQLFWTEDWTADGNGIARTAEDRETSYLMFNNSVPPFDDAEFRRAVAHCTDRQEYLEFFAPEADLANGPFAPGAAGYMEDPGFPEFDPDEGNRILDEIGRQAIEYGTTNVPLNLSIAELFQAQWSENCGLDVSINQFEQTELITIALTGDFQVFAWRNHGQGNPGLEYVWWHSRHAEGLALNFGRIVNPDLDALLDETRATLDQDELDRIGQEINQEFAAEVHNLWLNTTDWQIPYRDGVSNVGNLTLESGNPVQGQLAGRVWLHEVWIDG